MHKILKFSWSPVYLFFCNLYLWCHIQDIINRFNVRKLLSYVFLKVCVLGLTFSSLIRFELLFVYGIGKDLISFFCIWRSFFLYHLLKRLNFLLNWSWQLCQKSFDHIQEGLFLGCLFHWSTCLSSCQYHVALMTVSL